MKNMKKLSLFLTVCLASFIILGNSPLSNFALADTTIEFNDVSVNSTSINAGESIGITVDADDAGSSISSIEVTVASPSGSQTVVGEIWSATLGPWSGNLLIPQSAEGGLWKVQSVKITDGTGFSIYNNDVDFFGKIFSVYPQTTKAITLFKFAELNPAVVGVINEADHTVALTVPYGTDVAALVPMIVTNGASVSPASDVANNFTTPKTYTVTAGDGSTQPYVVTVTTTPDSAKAITAFTIPDQVGATTINEADHAINLTMPFGTDVTALIPTITIAGVSVSPASGVAMNFTNPKIYTVTSAVDASDTQAYTVTVTVMANPAKAITAFTIPNQVGDTTINESAHTINLTMPFGTDVTALIPTITITGISVSPASGVAMNFTNPKTYTVVAADATTQAYEVTVTVTADSTKAITSFNFANPAAIGVINETDHTIALNVPFGTDVTALIPTITITGVSVSPASGVAMNFTNPKTYTVAAADTTTQAYVVTVTVASNSSKAITSFTITNQVGVTTINESAHTINLTMPYGSVVTALRPTIAITGASVSPASGVAMNFTNPRTYTVVAADATTQAYIVTVTVALNPAKAITSFNFTNPAAIGVINETNHTIALIVSYGTDVTALVPTITITGASVSPASGVAMNFTNPRTYTVVAADSSTQAYIVTVSFTANPAKAITSFTITNQVGVTTINESAHTINLTMPYGTNVTALIPTITITGASVSPASGVAMNFTNPKTYTVIAEDSSTQAYTVTVALALNPAKAITAFTIPNQIGDTTIDEVNHTVALTMPYGTNVTALIPTITITGISVSPASGVAMNFTNPKTYTVVAEDSSTQAYTVTVALALNPAKAITAFSFEELNPAVNGVINETDHTIILTLPYSTSTIDVTALIPTITITGASVSPASGVAMNFTNPRTYTVVAADSSTQAYIVTVNMAASSDKAITSFTILNQLGNTTINETDHTIALTMPYGTDVTGLIPTIAIAGSSVSPVSGMVQNFVSPVTYTVTAADATTQDYTVTVTVAFNPAKAITAFTILNQVGDATIDEVNHLIALTMPYGTDVTALIPTITIIGVSVSPASGVAQDFTNPATYTVTAADSSTQAYIVTVNKALNSAKAITAFTIPNQVGNTTINEVNHTVAVTMPYGTNVADLTPTITITGVSVNPASGVAQDFTGPKTYTVTAADTTTQAYVVTVTAALNSAKAITSFNFVTQGSNTIIDETAHTIAITMSYGTVVTALVPTITVSAGASVNPASGVAHDFTSPVIYTVTAADGSTQAYTVIITVAGGGGGGGGGGGSYSYSSAKAITAFSFAGLNPIIGTIDETNYTVLLVAPYGTDVTHLVPTITISDKARISPASDVAQNFTNPVIYTVTAESGAMQAYTVTIAFTQNIIKGDINRDGKVDKYDFSLMMANWGRTDSNVADVNADGKVDKYDFSLLMLNWSI
ncbi:MAG: DUF5018 domain-containing protein [Patescibacteria group bacterium]